MNAPRLTANVLEDLKEAAAVLDEEINYLETSIPSYDKKHPLRQRLVDRYNKLIRARNWIVGKVAAEITKRET